MGLSNLFKSWSEDSVVATITLLTPEQKWQKILAETPVKDPQKRVAAQFRNEVTDETDATFYTIATECLRTHVKSDPGTSEFAISGWFLESFTDYFQYRKDASDPQKTSFEKLMLQSIDELAGDSKATKRQKKEKTQHLTGAARHLFGDQKNADFKDDLIKTYTDKGDVFLDQLYYLAMDYVHIAPAIWAGIKSKWVEDKIAYDVKDTDKLMEMAEHSQDKNDPKSIVSDMAQQITFPQKDVAYRFSASSDVALVDKMTEIGRNRANLIDDQALETMKTGTQTVINKHGQKNYEQEKLLTAHVNFWNATIAKKPEHAPDVYMIGVQIAALAEEHKRYDAYETANELINKTRQGAYSTIIKGLFSENVDDVKKMQRLKDVYTYRTLFETSEKKKGKYEL